MIQSRLTDFFAARKKNTRFNEEQLLMAKQKRVQVMDNELILQKAPKQIRQDLGIKQAKFTVVNSISNQGENSKPKRPMKSQIDQLKKKMERFDALKPEILLSKLSSSGNDTKGERSEKKIDKSVLLNKINEFNKSLTNLQQNITHFNSEYTNHKIENSEPAFVKYQDLASSNLNLDTILTLSVFQSRFLESFRACDAIVKFLYNRQEICTFLKLKTGIQTITKRSFDLKHLEMIKSVYENAYDFKEEKMFIDFKNDYHLIITPKIQEHNSAQKLEFSSDLLSNRLDIFRTKLILTTKYFHKEFLKSIGITSVDINDYKRWHPEFDLNSIDETEFIKAVKNVNESDAVPENISETIKNEIKFDIPKSHNNESKLEQSSANKKDNCEEDNQICTSNKANYNQKETRSFSSLLERIKKKVKGKMFEKNTVNTETGSDSAKHLRFKDVIRFLLSYFQAEKKSTLELQKICSKMSEHFKQTNDQDSRVFINQIIENADLNNKEDKKWLKIIKVRNTEYIQMDKSFTLSELWNTYDKLC